METILLLLIPAILRIGTYAFPQERVEMEAVAHARVPVVARGRGHATDVQGA